MKLFILFIWMALAVAPVDDNFNSLKTENEIDAKLYSVEGRSDILVYKETETLWKVMSLYEDMSHLEFIDGKPVMFLRKQNIGFKSVKEKDAEYWFKVAQ